MRISALYTHAPYLLQADQHCFITPLSEWENRSVYEMKRWLQTHTDHVRECRRQADRHTKQYTQDIRTYIPTPHVRTPTHSTIPRQAGSKTSQTDFHPSLVSRQSTISKYFPIRPTPPIEVPDTVTTYPHLQPLLTSHRTQPPSIPSLVQTPPQDQFTLTRPSLQTTITKYFN